MKFRAQLLPIGTQTIIRPPMSAGLVSAISLSAGFAAFALATFCLGGSPQLFAESVPQSSAHARAVKVVDGMPHAKPVDQVAISPDGKQVAYIVAGKLSVVAVGGGEPRRIKTESELELRDISWSRDSQSLTFLADLAGDKPASQLWIWMAATAKPAVATKGSDSDSPRKLADLRGYAESPRFSPDSERVAVLFIENFPRVAGPLQPMTPLAGEIDERIFEQRLAVVDIKTGHLRQVSPADVYVYEFDWMPDGKGWVVSAAHGNGDANWWVARLFRMDAQSGTMEQIYAPQRQIADPQVSPDGKNVAFIEGLMSDQGVTGGDIYVVSLAKDDQGRLASHLAGNPARNLTPGIRSSPASIAWIGSDVVAFGDHVDGNSGLGTVHLDGTVRRLWSGGEVAGIGTGSVPGASFSADGSAVAVVRQSPMMPSEVWAGPVGQWKQITQINAKVKPTWGWMRNFHWKNGDTTVQGWLLLPKNYDANKMYPLVVQVHGGPSSACTANWDESRMGPLSAMGYFALCPNPRGSYGQGEAFAAANVKDFGGGDYRDIMAGVDALLLEYPIDRKRLGIRGHSYGGYMVMWAETQTQRFAAAVSGAGLSNWVSYYGLNDIDEWMIPFFGASVYDDPEVYAKSDPMHFLQGVKTPTLILVGDRDGEVPMEQSVEWWHALKARGVPTKLVVYPNEGHAFVRPADARDYSLRSLEWLEEWFAKSQSQ